MTKLSAPIEKRVYYPLFDWVRLVAASIVMFFHGDLITWSPSAKIAVDVFFALSGWLIGDILLHTSKEDLPKFYFKRAIRIWIPYFVALILLIVVSLLKDPVTVKWFEFVFYKLTFIYNLFGPQQLADNQNFMPLNGTGNHFWSVNAEEQFYLFAPIFLVLLPFIGKNVYFWVLLAFFAWFYNIYSPLFMGVLAAILVNKHGKFHEKKIFKYLFSFILFLSIMGFIFSENYNWFSPPFAISLVLLLAIEGKATNIGKFLGGISYPLYLNHWLGIFIGNYFFGLINAKESFFNVLSAMIFGYIIAALFYLMVDRPCLSMRMRWYTDTKANYIIFIAYGTFLLGLTVTLILF